MGTSGERARSEVAKALRSDMETPKALYRVKSGEGVQNAFWPSQLNPKAAEWHQAWA